MTCPGSLASRAGEREGRRRVQRGPWRPEGLPGSHCRHPQRSATARGRAPTYGTGRPSNRAPRFNRGLKAARREAGTGGLGGDTRLCRQSAGRRREGALRTGRAQRGGSAVLAVA